jgi:acyl-CoA reductase-like NAD-dependent aldehyde dehydrogenase
VHPATVLTGVTEEMELHQTEAFGPVCALSVFDDDEEAIALANATEHGLTCGIITETERTG